MIIDNPKEDISDQADYVIVGSGCAGSTMARWLSAGGYQVIVVEEGKSPKITEGSSLACMSELYRDAGTTVAIGTDSLPLLQGKCLGGGSVINAGIQIRFPEMVWQNWVAQDPKWKRMLPWNLLMEANDILDRELHIAETPSHLLGGNGKMMLKGFGQEAHPIRRNTPQCKGSGRCILGCPNHGKASTDTNYLRMAEERGGKLFTQCAITNISMNGTTATGVTGRFSSGATFTAHASKAVILAASAIQTPWLLARCGLKQRRNGFMAHPGASIMGLFDEDLASAPQGTQTAEVLHYLKEDIKFETMVLPRDLKAARIPGTGKLLQSRLEKLNHTAYWQVCCKAEARGKVSRSPIGALVQYSPTPRDRAKILRGVSMMAEAMLRAGAREVWPSVYGVKDVISTIEEARAIAEVPAKPGIVPMAATHFFCGVTVDQYFQVDGAQRLVVADSSLFPSNIGVNPMSSIMSVAALVAQSCMNYF